MMPRPAKPSPRFGSIEAVDPALFMLLPLSMQGEGVRLMLEFGASLQRVANHLGLRKIEVENLAAERTPFHRGGEVINKEEP